MSRPPRVADALIGRSIRRSMVARTIIGDLHEEYAGVRQRRSAAFAVLWYWLQALRIAAHYRFGCIAGSAMPGSRRRWRADLWPDLRYALRGVRRNPVLSATMVTTLALAIGVNATMFGIIDRLLLSAPPQIHDADSVVRLNVAITAPGGEPFVMQATSYATFDDLLVETRAFEGWAAVAPHAAVLGSGEGAIAVAASAVSGGYFDLLGATPQLGRVLNPADDREPSGSPVVVISHRLWQRRFGGARTVLGTEALVDGDAYAIVGVAPPGFRGDGLEPIDLWLPINAAFADEEPSWRHDRRRRMVSVIGRIAAGTSRIAARDDASRALARSVASAGVDAPPLAVLAPLIAGRGPAGVSMQARISLWLGGVAAVVLVVALANVTNLLLLRGEQRRHEIVVRRALGMGWTRLLRQTLTETALLAAAGGLAALLVAAWTADIVRSWLLPEMAAPATPLSAPEVASIATAALLAALTTGALPALHASTASRGLTRSGGRGSGALRSRMRDVLLASQTAMSVVLLVGAGLFVASLRSVQGQDLGMHLDGVLVAEIQFAGGELPGPERDELYRDALAQARKVPGVELAVAAQALPFGSFMTLPMSLPGKDFRALFGGRQLPYYHAVEPAFFELMGIEIVAGRELRATDDATAPPAVVVSESLARYVWGGDNPLGRCMRAGMHDMPTPESFLDGAGEEVPCYEIVGVSADVEERSLLPEDRLTMQWYTTFEQMPPMPPTMTAGPRIQALLIKAPADTDEVAATVRRVVQGSSKRIAYVDVRPYRELIDPRARSWQLGAALFTAFGTLALVIAAVGMYGVFAHAVTERTRELGVRMALGARPLDVARLIIGASLRTVAAGVVVGGAIALWSAGYIEELLYETDAHDPVVLAGVVAVLAGVALAASLIPAMRATRTDPRVTLKQC